MEPKMSKKRRTGRVILIVCIVLSSLTPIIAFAFLGVYFLVVDTDIEKQVEKELEPLCTSNMYAYMDYESNTINLDFFRHYCFDGTDFKTNPFPDYENYYFYFLLYDSNYYYFDISYKSSLYERKDVICRVDHELNNCKTLYQFDLNLGPINSGFDNKLYFKKGSNYFTFNVETLELIESEKDSEEEKLAKMSMEDFTAYFGYCFGNCKRKERTIVFSFSGEEKALEENKIDEKVCEMIDKFHFKPKRYFANSELTSILYFDNYDLFGVTHCLIVNYYSSIERECDYQLFNSCFANKFQLYPKIEIGYDIV